MIVMVAPSTSTLQTLILASLISPKPRFSRKVAVIGAGAAGLVASRELRREGHKVVVFESNDKIGGSWVYNPNVESDPLGLDPFREIVQTSLYDSLRTTIPREVMGFRDFPFMIKEERDRDPRRFPGHREVLFYLQDFARHFQIIELCRFQTEVLHVGLVEEGKWAVRTRSRAPTDQNGLSIDSDEIYDGVVVCNGHYTEPRIAKISGIDVWPGKQIHSHNYRVPEPFQDQVVIVIGSSSSAVDISRDIAGVAKEVHIASRSATDGAIRNHPGYDHKWIHSMIESAHEDGTVMFQDGSSIIADVILHCTGYKYHFPFLKTDNIVTVDDSRVGPLYQHVFPPSLAPWISFIGIPLKAVPFPLFELQCKWVAGVLSGQISLPSPEEMIENVKAFYSKLESQGRPKHYTHNLSEYQFEYCNWLAAECGCPLVEEWRKQIYSETVKNRQLRPDTYRDEWDDQHLLLLAEEDFLQYASSECITKCLFGNARN